ncbi:MAG: TMEM175 family protein [Candidatus Binataceae bacterium]
MKVVPKGLENVRLTGRRRGLSPDGLWPATKIGAKITELFDAVEGSERDTARIEAFSDGVFSIAITLLILEIRVPHPQAASDQIDLWRGLGNLWPSYLAYILSFVTIGIYWARHHYVFMLFDKTNHVLCLLNLLFLMCISFLPLPTSVMASYMCDKSHQVVTAAACFYALGLLLPSAAWTLMWLYACSHGRLFKSRLDDGLIHRLTFRYVGSLTLYLCAVLLSLLDFRLGLGVCVGLTLLYLLPPPDPRAVRSELSLSQSAD